MQADPIPPPKPPLSIAINGYGRIGRCVLRALFERNQDALTIQLINEPADLASMAYLTEFDSIQGRFIARIQSQTGKLNINDHTIHITHQREPEAVDWSGVDLLLECSGVYHSRAQLMRFIDAGVPRLLVSQPCEQREAVDATVVYGYNHEQLQGGEKLVSNASCTTSAVVPILHILNQTYGIEQVMLTTLHALMNDQPVLDGYHHKDLRRTRSGIPSLIPVETGLTRGVTRLLPELCGKVESKALRVPTLNVSAIDVTLYMTTATTVAEVNQLLKSKQNAIIGYTDLPHASIDFVHDAHSVIIDASQTRVVGGKMVNLLLWFDNEWGFAERMLDTARYWHSRLT